MTFVDGIMYCIEHGGLIIEGTDYTGEPFSLGCEYKEQETNMPCRSASLYFDEGSA